MADAEVGDTPLNPEVQVLLATCNGEHFLREQIDSILAQDYPALRILASDDASSDATARILNEYAGHHPERFAVLPAHPATGSAKDNFLLLMNAASAEYISFADQDDVWLPDKVSRSVTAMQRLEKQHGNGTPLLVFSDLRVVDEHLQTLAASMWRHMGTDPASIHCLPRLIGRSVVTGCTMLINRRLLELARQMPPEAPMHDRWIALLAATMGASAILTGPTVLYRQHVENVIGAAAPDGSLSGITRRASDGSGRHAERLLSERLAATLLRLHGGQVPVASANLLQLYLQSGSSQSAFERVWLTLHNGFFRGTLLQNSLSLLDLARSPTRPT